MILNDIQKKSLVKELVANSFYQAGINLGLDKQYKNRSSLVSAVRKVYQEVKKDPEQYAVSKDIIDLIEKNLKERQSIMVGKTNDSIMAHEKKELSKMTVNELVNENSKKSAVLLHKKLDMIGKSKKELASIGLGTLVTAYGITFDKSRLILGESTENISVLAKIKTENLTPEEMMDIMLKKREANQTKETKQS
jgi:hypothetical protein